MSKRRCKILRQEFRAKHGRSPQGPEIALFDRRGKLIEKSDLLEKGTLLQEAAEWAREWYREKVLTVSEWRQTKKAYLRRLSAKSL